MSPEISFVRPTFMLAQLNDALAPFASTPVRKAAPKLPTRKAPKLSATEVAERERQECAARAASRKAIADAWLHEVSQKQKPRRGVRLAGGVCRPFATRNK